MRIPDSSQPLRIGVAGSGFAANFHCQNFQGTNVRLAGVTSPRPDRREAFAARYAIQAFDSVDAMLNEIDVLDVCTPPSSHTGYILAAAKANF